MQPQITSECYAKAIQKLLQNSTKFGLIAASANSEGTKKNYDALVTRDIGVSSLGILASKNEELIQVLKTSLATLAEAQAANGQIPFDYKPEKKEVQWRSSGSIDGTIWWSIAVLQYVDQTKDEHFYSQYKEQLEKAFIWLSYQDVNNDNLLEQGEAADWADEMPRRGTVLYTNAIWYWLVKLRIEVERRHDLEPLLQKIHTAFNTLFWIRKGTSSNFSYIPDNSYTQTSRHAKQWIEYINTKAVYLPYYIGYVSHKDFEMRCEVFGNILACLVGLADKGQAKLITDFILRSGTNLPYPVKAMYPPIYPGEQDFKEYMTKGRQNYPWQYHNGGIWPFIGGFWVMWLAQSDKELAQKELIRLAEANKLFGWEFNEYLHGQHGTPMGVANQSWNMAMYLAAHTAVSSAITDLELVRE